MQQGIGQLFKEYQELAIQNGEDLAQIKVLQEKVVYRADRMNAIEKQIDADSKRTKRISSFSHQVSDDLKEINFVKEAMSVLYSDQKCMTVRELVDRIKKNKSISETPGNDRYILGRVSNDLRARVMRGKDVKRIKRDNDYFYGLITWFNEDGSLQMAYEFDDLLPF